MSHPPAQDERVHTFNVSLTVYTLLKKTTRGARKVTTVKEEKSVKVKELPFAINEDNYINFLTSLLEKHGQEQYKVSEKCCFPFKYVPLKSKGQHSGDGMAIDNESDYKEMVQKIREHDVSKTKVFVDMKDVEKLLMLSVGMVKDEEDETGPIVEACGSKASDMDMHLMRWRLMLQTCHKNEFGDGYTYIGLIGLVVLTPSLIMDWCHALIRHATLSTPPNIESFNLVMKGTPLHQSQKAQLSQPAPLPVNGIDVNSLTSPTAAATPSQPVIASNNPPILAVPVPSLPDVEDSACYEEPLRLENIGPDILTNVDEKTLGRIGILIGDIAHLKRYSIAWWNGQDSEAKRKWSGTRSTSSDAEPTHNRTRIVSPPPQKKKVTYEKRYHGGGGCRFTGPMMEAGDADPNTDYDLYYECDMQKQWLPVPCGFIVIEDEEEPEDEDNSDNTM
ncbi:hypothetical protein V8E55_004597 [Tylopilus felleus]